MASNQADYDGTSIRVTSDGLMYVGLTPREVARGDASRTVTNDDDVVSNPLASATAT